MTAAHNSTPETLTAPLMAGERSSPSPSPSPSPSLGSVHPPWSRPHTGLGRDRRRSSLFGMPSATSDPTGFRDRAIDRIGRSYQRVSETFGKMTILQKIGSVIAGLCVIALGLGFMAVTGQIFAWLGPVAKDWENAPLAYFILWLCTFLMSFPPMVGWSTVGTVSGFIFGVWKGWAIYASATVIGSTCSFYVSRTVLSKFVQRLMKHDKRFAALSLTLKYDGLKLLCMIRLCPLPYSLCNGAVSTFPTVSPLMYGLATAIISPKFLVPTFIGSRLRILSEDGGEMSTGSKAVNIISILVSVAAGVFTGWYIYKRTLARAKQLEAEERANLRGPTPNNQPTTASPGVFSDDPNASSLARDEEEAVGVDDAVAIDIDDDNVALDPSYHDFTDNESDIFADGDGDDKDETYKLHRHVDSR
ncbi:golgi apparatus membrane protein tvp38 [Trichophyton violaceum]|uniref:Golgi apparatus membrane protein TVP38 n=1 Tax=Trichophyton violaceum TaxID=34388 RepID=A0A178FDC9_TRIVO|nr:golgi apparatus membrane protein tvp38 [Trichophyton violaceum]